MKTESEAGDEDYLTIMFYAAEHEDIYDYKSLGFVSIYFDDPIEYRVSKCQSGYQEFDTQPPKESNKVWTFSKTGTDFTIACNGVELSVVNFESENCDGTDEWSQDVAKMWFWTADDSDDDTATDAYRKLGETGQLMLESSALCLVWV